MIKLYCQLPHENNLDMLSLPLLCTTSFATCTSTSELITEYVTMDANSLLVVCDASTYSTNPNEIINVSAIESSVPCSNVEADLTIEDQAECGYAIASASRFFGDSARGGEVSTSFYVATGAGNCTTTTNSFYTRDFVTGPCATSADYCIGAGSGNTCNPRSFGNNEVKFSSFLKLHGTAMTGGATSFGGNCTSGNAPTHVVGRISVSTSNLGINGKISFNGDDSVSVSNVGATTEINTVYFRKEKEHDFA